MSEDARDFMVLYQSVWAWLCPRSYLVLSVSHLHILPSHSSCWSCIRPWDISAGKDLGDNKLGKLRPRENYCSTFPKLHGKFVVNKASLFWFLLLPQNQWEGKCPRGDLDEHTEGRSLGSKPWIGIARFTYHARWWWALMSLDRSCEGHRAVIDIVTFQC